MSVKRILLGVILSAGVVACQQDNPAPVAASGGTPLTAVAPPLSPSTPPTGDALPGKDARFTLACQTFTGYDHMEQATRAKALLQQTTPLKGWYVVQCASDSQLYYGFYRSFNNPSDPDSQRAQNDRKAIEALTDSTGKKQFPLCLFVALILPDPSAPPEWNLVNARGYWSLEVAAFKDSPFRKQAAVDFVRQFRSRGIEAYYYHGDTISSVLIGAWPADAIKRQETDQQANADPTKSVIIVDSSMPQEFIEQLKQKVGDNVTIVATRVEPQDPTMIKAMQDYPEHYVNGQLLAHRQKNIQTGREELVPDQSFLVQIPAAQPTALGSSDQPNQAVQPSGAPEPPIQSQPLPPGIGKLKSIGD